MIRFFLQAENVNVAAKLRQALYGENGLATWAKEQTRPNGGIKLLLIHLNVKKFESVTASEILKIGRYSKNEMSISVEIKLDEKVILESDDVVRSTLIARIRDAVALVEESAGKGIDCDFSLLREALNKL